MTTMSLTPAEIAVRDQARALVRDLVAGGVPVIFADYPDSAHCCWCNCPADAGDDHPCPGCMRPAEAELRIVPDPPNRESWPVCLAHYDDALRVLQLYVAAAMPG